MKNFETWKKTMRNTVNEADSRLHPDERAIHVPSDFRELALEECGGYETRSGLGYVLSDGVYYDAVEDVIFAMKTI